MITLNGKKYAANKKEFSESIFTDQTCTGFYKVVKNGIRLMDQQGEPFAFVYDNGRSDRGIVSCRKHGKRYRYMFSTMTMDEKKLGFENGLGYVQSVELAEKLLNEVFPDKYKVYL